MAYLQTEQPRRGPFLGGRLPGRPVGAWPALKWLGIAGVGALLGLYALGAAALPSNIAALLLMAMLLLVVAVVAGNVRRMLMGLILLDIPFQMDVHISYRDDLAALNAIGGVSISVTTIALALLYALWFSESLGRVRQPAPRRAASSITIALLGYLAFAALSLLVARDTTLGLYEIVLLVQTFLLYLYIVSNVRTRRDVLFIATMLLLALVAESLLMIGIRAAGHSLNFAGISARMSETRVGGTIGSPNAAASYLTLFLGLALSCLLNRLARPARWLSALAFVLGLAALALTLSRGGWIAFVLLTALLYLAIWRHGRLSPSTLVIVGGGALLLALLFGSTIGARLAGEDASTPEARLHLIQLAARIIQEHPILGVGANNFALAIPTHATPDFSGEWLHVVHNKYLLVWAEVGIGGLLAFLWFLFATIRQGWRCWKQNDPLLAPLALGLTAGVVGQMVHMFFDLFHGRPQVQGLWLVAGLIVAIGHVQAGEKPVYE